MGIGEYTALSSCRGGMGSCVEVEHSKQDPEGVQPRKESIQETPSPVVEVQEKKSSEPSVVNELDALLGF